MAEVRCMKAEGLMYDVLGKEKRKPVGLPNMMIIFIQLFIPKQPHSKVFFFLPFLIQVY